MPFSRLKTKIPLLDYNWEAMGLLEPLLKDEAIRKSPHVGDIAWHGYGGDPAVQLQMHDKYGMDTFLTVRSGFGGGSRQHRQDMRLIAAVFRN